MFFSPTKYFEIVNTLSDLSKDFNDKHDAMVQSMPLNFVDKYLRRGYCDYCLKMNYRIDSCEYIDNDNIEYRNNIVDSYGNRFFFTVANLSNENLAKLKVSKDRAKKINRVKIAEICFKTETEGSIIAFLEKSESGYKISLQKYMQNELDHNRYDLVKTETFNMTEEQIFKMFNFEVENSVNCI